MSGNGLDRGRWRQSARQGRLGIGLMLFLSGGMAGAEEIIVESRDGGMNPDRYEETAGVWVNSQIPPEATKSGAPGLSARTIGTRRMQFYRTDGEAETTAPASFRFRPMVDEAGRYRVEVTWPKSANARPVHVLIQHARGLDRMELEQNGRGFSGAGNADKWVRVGEYEFSPGREQFVELQLDPAARPIDPGSNGLFVADAARFTRLVGEGAAGGGTAPALVWRPGIDEARQEAARSGKKLLIFFTAPGCEPCRELEKSFASPEVARLLTRDYVLGLVDMSRFNLEDAHKLGVFRGGTVNVYNSRGEALAQFTQPLPPAALAERLRGL